MSILIVFSLARGEGPWSGTRLLLTGVVTASGMSAVHLVTQLLKPGELIVAPHDCYGGCHRLFTAASNRGLFDLEWLPLWETGL